MNVTVNMSTVNMSTVAGASNPFTTALKSTASLAEVTTTSLGLARKDKAASTKLDSEAHAAPKTAKVMVDRLSGASDLHDRFKGLHQEARDNLWAFSTRWGENAQRLMPHANIERWGTRHMQIVKAHDALLKELEDQVDTIIQRAFVNLGEFAQRVQPPTRKELLEAYSINHRIIPFPDESGFDHLPADTAAFLKQQYELDNQAAYNAGQQDLKKRLAEQADNLITRLENFSKREDDLAAGKSVGREGIFRDAALSNVQDILAMLPSNNLMNDPLTTKLHERLKLLMGVSADDLKKNPDLRKKAIEDMKAVFADSLLPGV